MEDFAPLDLWLQIDGCCNGPSWVVTEFNFLGFLFLRHGWKSFALAQGMRDGHILHLKFDRATTLFVMVFESVGGRVGCCTEDSSGSSSTDDSGSNPFPDGGGGDSIFDSSLGACMKEEADSN
ncbi:heat shock cognate 70 kda protein 1 [Hordeum vulgare]|nr:heat shock cognate 70 kda protein 1 [Hordeum vulgare]